MSEKETVQNGGPGFSRGQRHSKPEQSWKLAFFENLVNPH